MGSGDRQERVECVEQPTDVGRRVGLVGCGLELTDLQSDKLGLRKRLGGRVEVVEGLSVADDSLDLEEQGEDDAAGGDGL